MLDSVDGVADLIAALRPEPPTADISAQVQDILRDVKQRGDDALVDQVRRHDCADFTRKSLAVSGGALAGAAAALDPALREAILVAAEQVRTVARQLVPSDTDVSLPAGQYVRLRTVPVSSAGCYVPGGRAAYPSSLIMAAVPAQVAGVDRVVVTSPPGPDGLPAAVVLATAHLLGIDEVYAAGGAAAVAALAFGTAAIAPVAVVVGPGNAWVAEAKRQVSGTVGIDSIAGPSEVLVIADATVDPRFVALDLLAQREHGADSPAILATDDGDVIDGVAAELARHGNAADGVALVRCASRRLAVALAEAFAPEHLQLNVHDAADLAGTIRCAGAVFVGPNGGTAFGDYVAGSNHVLPTGGAARFASALGPSVYLRCMAVVDMTQEAVDTLTPHLAALANAEGFPFHRRSAEARTTSGDTT
jgi:histidinol dehydrogenase